MKTPNPGFTSSLLSKLTKQKTLLAAVAAFSCVSAANAQLYVTSDSGNKVGTYNYNGSTINSSLITGLSGPYGLATNGSSIFVGNIGNNTVTKYSLDGTPQGTFSVPGAIGLAVLGNTLYAADYTSGVINTYNATTGAALNLNFITGLDNPRGLAFDTSGNIFVTNFGSGNIGKYNATTGAEIDAEFITGVTHAFGITLDGDDMYVSNFDFTINTIGKFNAADGSVINRSFVTEIGNPTGLVVHDGSLYAASYAFSTIGQFSTADGSAINRNLITGLANPIGLIAVPEPGTYALLALSGVAFLAFRKRNSL